ncbi:MAG: hypothetical protein M5U30_13930 [Burkholderiaceae bacterium]|nr:hypothetical protein [Burkholderiaceae bacterium]
MNSPGVSPAGPVSGAAAALPKPMSSIQAAVTYVPATTTLLVAVAVVAATDIDAASITMDTTAYLGEHPLTGALSNLGILLWCAAASISLLAALLTARAGNPDRARFLLASSLLTFYLLFDDLFLIHEDLAWRYLGIGQKTVLVALGAWVGTWLLAFRREILTTNWGALALAIVFLSISVLTDLGQGVLQPRIGDWIYMAEDGPKWLGIVSWCSYLVQTAYRSIFDATSLGPP